MLFPDSFAKVNVPGPINEYHQNDEQDCNDDSPDTKSKFFPGEMPAFPTGKGSYGAIHQNANGSHPKKAPIEATSNQYP